MSGEEFLLKWNDHHNSFFSIMQDLCSSETLTDVTLACGGRLFETHKIMLCVCSSFFRSILARPTRPDRASQHPIVFLKDILPKHLEQLLQYMYNGEINVLQEDLAPLIEAARCLQVKGLSDAPTAPPPPPKQRLASQLPHPPPMKKARVNNLLQNQHHKQRKPESPTLSKSKNNSNNSAPTTPAVVAPFMLPSEPDPPEMIKEEQAMEQWNNQSDDADVSQSGGSDYEINPEMYSEELEEEQFYHGSQSVGVAAAAAAAAAGAASTNSTAGGGGGGGGVGGVESRLRYRCTECGKGFITPSKLQRHSYSHTGLRPFHCDVCGKSFSQSANLKTHIKNTHPELSLEESNRAAIDLNKQFNLDQMSDDANSNASTATAAALMQ